MTITKSPVLTKDTLIPLGVVVFLLSGVCALVLWLSGELTKIQYQMTDLSKQIATLQATSKESLSKTEMSLWVELFKAKNPDLKIPQIPK